MSAAQPPTPPLRALVGAVAPRTLVVAGIRLAYDDDPRDGDDPRPVMVCLHAIGHGARDYAGLRDRLRDRFRVVAFDWPGHGASDDDVAPASAERYAEILTGFLAGLGVERVLLVGNSVGGAAAIRYAAAHPDRVRGLVVANPGGLFRRGLATRLITRALARGFRAGARGARWFPRVFAAYYRRVLREPDAAAQRARIVASAREIAPVLAEAWTSFASPASDLRDVAATLRMPVLVAWATRDPVNPLWANRAGIARIPDATCETFAAGHSPFLETPAAFDAALHRFTARLPCP
ncbi:MAG: alpha/beta fold hydrolase [Kofleriaceae bacterium]|nr:alpha/beta fold hydrolase [Myxococcales bacterium]MCB9561294.1 alpha/beta fold hydrolase [Kofleriaceae bacterium]